MLLQRGLFLYLFIFIILIVIFVFSHDGKKSDAWLTKLPKEEQKLYKLEMQVSSNEDDINITLAPKYYQKREIYCSSFPKAKEYKNCMQRTMPWWGQKFKEHILQRSE